LKQKEMKRIFIAVDISDEARRRAAAHIDELRIGVKNLRVGWERPEKLHLTVKFLGDATNEQLERLNGAVEQTASQARPFYLRTGKTGVFPSIRKARVLWLGLEDAGGELRYFHRILETECEKAGFARETRDFKPHLTIARLREPGKSAGLAATHLRAQIEPVEFEVPEIVIYESRLAPTGSVYRPVFKHKLAG
jgi:2'-5' RNA ligase